MIPRVSSQSPLAAIFILIVTLLPVTHLSGNAGDALQSPGGDPVSKEVSEAASYDPERNTDTNRTHQIIFPKDIPVSLTDKTNPGVLEWVTGLSTALSVIVTGLLSLWGLGVFNRRKDRISALESQLNAFHRPMLQLLETSRRLRDVLIENRSPDFRTLPALLENPEEFDEVDWVIIGQIVDVGREIEKVIKERSGHLLDESLREPLGDLSRHLMMFRLAAEKKLKGQSERFRHFVYPRTVNDEIKNEYQRLTRDLQMLQKKVVAFRTAAY